MIRQMLMAVLIGCMPVAWAQGGGAMPAAKVAVGKVGEAVDQESRRYTGTVVSQSVVHLVPRISGEILEVGFKDGSIVRKGQLLYRIDPIQYEAAAKSAEAQIAECKARLEYARSNFERNRALYESSAASLDNLESSRSTMLASEAALLAAEAGMIIARDNLKNTSIVSPIDGLAGVTNYTVGNYLTPAAGTLVTIIQVQPIRVRFSLSMADLFATFESMKAVEGEVQVKVKLADGAMHPEEGKVELLNNEANARTDTIRVYANFPNGDYRLVVGSTVSVLLSRKTGKVMPAVPPSAVMHDNQGAYVYLVQNGRADKRYVVLGNATPEAQMIASGLEKGQEIVVQGTHKVMPGMAIDVVPAVKEI